MSDVGAGDYWTRQALAQALAAGSPLGPPQAIPGALPGVLSPMGAGGAQGAPAGNPGASPGLLSRLWSGIKSMDPYPAYQANKAKGDFPGWGQVLNPLSDWNYQRYHENVARGQAGLAGPTPPQVPPPQEQPAPPPVVAPQPVSTPAPMPTDPNNPMPRVSAPQMVQQPQQPIVPPPQAAPGQPQQLPAIPPASAAGRAAAAQPQGNPLDQYFQQMMALQRQRMLLGMAGGLLGAPSLGIGLGRAFTNASNTVAPEGDLVSRIAGAQAAGQLARQTPGYNEQDVQAAQLQALFGKPFDKPEFHEYHYGDNLIGGSFRTPSGREMSAEYQNIPVWAMKMGFRTPDGKITYNPEQAEKRPLKDGRTAYMMSDGTPRTME